MLETIKQYFLPEEWLIPRWCHNVIIHWGDEGHPDACLKIQVHYDYRWARITVYPSWLTERDAAKREGVLHELIHISLSPLSIYAEETFATLIGSDTQKLKAHVDAQVRERVESVTQDLAYILAAKTERPPV